jgi:hypothetical protein
MFLLTLLVAFVGLTKSELSAILVAGSGKKLWKSISGSHSLGNLII